MVLLPKMPLHMLLYENVGFQEGLVEGLYRSSESKYCGELSVIIVFHRQK